MAQLPFSDYVLGLDIGANSLGWALVSLKDGIPQSILKVGVRVFEAGVEGDIESGKDQSRAAKRREARLHRRMLERRSRRLAKIAGLLQRAGLLPDGDLKSEESRIKVLRELDDSISARHHPTSEKPDPASAHLLPYRLRALALDQKLHPFELGRALYHLAHRRGFLSNRKAPAKDPNEEGKVNQGIHTLRQKIEESGARTLGEYFSRLDPEQERIRQRWTARDMLDQEFEAIWNAQAKHHPTILTHDFKKQLRRAIFHQRPLKIKKNLIADCELEKGQKVAPRCCLLFQRFRLLQQVNNLKVTEPTGKSRPLTRDERETLLHALETQDKLSFSEIKRLLKLRDHRFRMGEGDEEVLTGNKTAAKLREIFGDRWDELSPQERDRVVEDWWSIQKSETLRKHGVKYWRLDPEAAERLGKLALETGYCKLSKKAMRKLLPLMEEGISHAKAQEQLYGNEPPPKPFDELPPLDRAPLPKPHNPAVHRALTEVRKVVNAIIRRYGRPSLIRVELARDLKKSKEDRKKISDQIARNRRDRERAKKALIDNGIQEPSRDDIEKWLLYEECNGICPYTGKSISLASLFGPNPQFDVEHIIPFSRCLDNSFTNKTLCDIEENRNRKRNQTPYEAYGADPARWEEIIQRVKRFRGKAAAAKLHRFQLESVDSLEEFASKQLNDTAHASRSALRYLGLLYGSNKAGVGPDGRRRVQAGRGQVTAFLRDEWRLNSILGDLQKSRADHRHHAVDALAIALTDSRIIKTLSDAASRALSERRRRFGRVAPPWKSFLEEAKNAIAATIVSHRVSRKVSGALHEETIYSKPHTDKDGRVCHHIRKRLDKYFTRPMLDKIVDPVIRDIVRKHFQANGSDPKKAFSDPGNHPFLCAKDGRHIPIHSVRVREDRSTVQVGSGVSRRQVLTGSNHHVEIVEVEDEKGQPRWEGRIVTLIEAIKRLRNRQPIVQRDHGEGKKWVFSLAGGETIQLTDGGITKLYTVRTITVRRGQYVEIAYVPISDARTKTEIREKKEWRTDLLEPLRKLQCRKVLVTPLGEVRYARD